MVRGSTTPESLQYGRHVRHSRRGCTLCKERRIRCSEERPACAKCAKDGRSCEYVLRLTWEDESLARGVRHGRAASESKLCNKSSLLEPVKMKQDVPQDYGFYFINMNELDFGTSAIHQPPMSYESHRKEIAPVVFRSLETYDLDDIDRQLFQHYHSQVCVDLTLVDDMSNGYRYIVIPMSMTHGSVMQSILAVSALYLSLRQTSSSVDYYALALRHKQKTLKSLRQEIASLDGTMNDHILISMLMLCLLDITDNCQTSWPTHLSAAAKLFSSQANTYEPSLSSFVSKFFAVRDVMSRTACGARSKFERIAWHNPQEIDNTIGCSYMLLNIISSITDLTNRTRNGPDAEQRLLTIETELDTLVQLMPLSSAFLSATETIMLLRTSSLIHTATKIYFYTALHSAMPLTPLIQRLVRNQIEMISGLPDLRSAHLWSIFVTALYVEYDEDRIFFLRQFERLEAASAAVGQTATARTVVETVWKRRDLEASTPMSDGGDGRGSDWERLVKPMSEGISLA